MVVAASQQGLSKVAAKLNLGPSEFTVTYCVNPEKEVSSTIFDKLERDDVNKDALLEYIGYVPRDIHTYLLIPKIEQRFDLFKASKKANLIMILQEEEEEEARYRSLAIICSKTEICSWIPESLQWTCLKTNDVLNIQNVSCVSPAVYEATVEYMSTEPKALMWMVEHLNILTNKPSCNIGHCLQPLVFARLQRCTSTIGYWFDSDGEKMYNTLSVAGYTSRVSHVKCIIKYKRENPNIGTGVIINFPFAADYDIVIIDLSGVWHGIQVTATMGRVEKCAPKHGREPFYMNASCTFKYIFTPETVFELSGRPTLEGFQLHKLRVLKPSILISESELSHFRKNSF